MFGRRDSQASQPNWGSNVFESNLLPKFSGRTDFARFLGRTGFCNNARSTLFSKICLSALSSFFVILTYTLFVRSRLFSKFSVKLFLVCLCISLSGMAAPPSGWPLVHNTLMSCVRIVWVFSRPIPLNTTHRFWKQLVACWM